MQHNILSVNNSLSQETVKFMYKIIHKQLPVQFDNYFDSVLTIKKRSTRASPKKNQLYIPRFRTNRLQRSTKHRGVKVWDDIPNEIRNSYCNFSTFERIHKKTFNFTSDTISVKKLIIIFLFLQLFFRQH